MTKTNPEERSKMGRPPLPDDVRKKSGSIRLTPNHWAKLRRLGADWLSRALDQAKEPTSRQ
ncbi:hypothetical protein J2W25_005198 [Variovorax boronicumulans]|uniref:Transcriptional regulator n=1 Tax=Variovorax boronicumulans TaxID=436515 RepID=A0AAW8E346_9BURK|nr:hypothetical protein [Variovorax boronicumulans]MDP9926151.1 hypothetical protein [Variovorax boronicumulans]